MSSGFILLFESIQDAVMAPFWFKNPNIPLSFFKASKDHLKNHSASLTRALNPKAWRVLAKTIKVNVI